MSYKNTGFRIFASTILALFAVNVVTPTLQFTFADSTQYYVDATGGSDANDGLTPATAWQTIGRVNSENLLQGDTVSFLCGETWSGEVLMIDESGNPWLPITYNGYGVGCSSSFLPEIPNVEILNASNISLDTLAVRSSSGTAVSVTNANSLNMQNLNVALSGSLPLSEHAVDIVGGSDITLGNSFVDTQGWNNVAVVYSGATNVIIDSNTWNIRYGISAYNSTSTISNNRMDSNASYYVQIFGAGVNTIENNHFGADTPATLNSWHRGSIQFGNDTIIRRNIFINNAGDVNGKILHNDAFAASNNFSNALIEENYLYMNNTDKWVVISNVNGTTMRNNTIHTTTQSEKHVQIWDSSNVILEGNTLVAEGQGTSNTYNEAGILLRVGGSSSAITLSNNAFMSNNPAVPFISLEGPTGSGTFMPVTANGNTFYTQYKPDDSSYVRSVKYGGETLEYKKNQMLSFDPTATTFDYFGYKTWSNTGSFATANLLGNPDFDTDISGWSASGNAPTVAPVLSHNPIGSNIGGSLQVTPQWAPIGDIRVTNDTQFAITSGNVYLVSGYVKSSTGNVHIKPYLHKAGNYIQKYTYSFASGTEPQSTYASASGRTFEFYVQANTTAPDAQLSFESDNPDIAYEIDSVSVRRKTGVIKNTNANEVLMFVNTGSTAYDQACPGGVPCFAYVDGLNATVSWPVSVPAYGSKLVFWNGSPNIVNTPTCTLNLSSGSVPTGLPVTVDWSTVGSLSQMIHYTTATGAVDIPTTTTGSISFIPPYDAITSISLTMENDIGPSACSVQVTTTNTPPTIISTTTTGSEDDAQINGTLSGTDYNPGDSTFFEQFGPNVAHGSLNVDTAGTFQYFPEADFCGTDTFFFRGYDQLGHYQDPVVQTILVDCVNDAPVAVADTASGTSGSPIQIDVLANDTDVDNVYTTQIFTLNALAPTPTGTVTINNNKLEYTPNGSFTWVATLQYSLIDQSGAISNTGNVSVTVTRFNTAPTAADLNSTANEDFPLTDTFVGSDGENDVLSFTAVTLPTHGTLSNISGANFTYTPNSNYFGPDSFTYRANDGLMNSNTATVNLTVTSLNDAPVAVNDSYTLSQDTTFFVPAMINDTDVDSTNLTLTGYTNPTNGTLTVSGTGFLYTPNTLYRGTDSFTYRIVDDIGALSNVATVSLNVSTTNQNPTATASSVSVNEDDVLNATLVANDPEGSTLTYTIDSLPVQGTLTVSNTGVYRYTPNTNYNGSDSFSFHVSDGSYNSSGATVSITVFSVNDLPTSSSANLSMIGNTMDQSGNVLTGALTANDIDSALLTFTPTTLPIHGAFTLGSAGDYTYTPALDYVGTDSFTYVVSDGVGTSTPVTVLITVSAVYVPPVYVPPVVSTSQNTGGGGWGGGANYGVPPQTFKIVSKESITNTPTPSPDSVDSLLSPEDLGLNAAPSEEQKTVFVLQDPSGLLGQLLLSRVLQKSVDPSQDMTSVANPESTITPTTEGNSVSDSMTQTSVLDSLDAVSLDEQDGPVILRAIARLFLREAKESTDPGLAYQEGIDRFNALDAENIYGSDSRVTKTVATILRLLELHQRKYEEMMNRNVTEDSLDPTLNLNAPSSTDPSLGTPETINTAPSDSTSDLDALLLQLQSLAGA